MPDIVDELVSELMVTYDIPGMALAITYAGRDSYRNFGVLDRESDRPITRQTLFEVGSISKLFTATMASYIEQEGTISLDAPVALYLDELNGRPLGAVPLFHLATHTAGGFPLQLPVGIDSEAALFEYYRSWRPAYAAGTQRSYANPSIGLLGVLIARVKQQSFVALMEQGLFPQLGMTSTYINVPDAATQTYAWGHNQKDKRVRVNPAWLANEAYGVKTTSTDLLRFLKLNLGAQNRTDKLARAIQRTQTSFFDVTYFQQALIWEKYPYPLNPCALRSGNTNRMIYDTTPVKTLPSSAEQAEAFVLSKTGSTAGFGAYVFAVPNKAFAVLLLANKRYPNEDRVKAAYQIAAEVLSFSVPYCDQK